MNRRGFTLVELLLAMTLFTTVMVIATAGFIAMNRSFTRGVVRKQLSEATQSLNEEVTRTVREQGRNALPLNCPADGIGCLIQPGWSAVCFGQVRFVWESDEDGKGMYKDTVSDSCNTAVPTSGMTQVFSDRYKIQTLTVRPIKEGLFRVQGLASTTETAALTTPTDKLDITCKGSAENSAVSTCATEKFDFIISARTSSGEGV